MRLFKRVIPTGIEHGTVTVLLRGGSYEVTTLRGEGAYTDSRRPDRVFFIDDIEQRPGAARLHGQRAGVRPARPIG